MRSALYGEVRKTGCGGSSICTWRSPKNGKTGLAAGLGLYHTFADGERSGEVYACAADRDNAGIVFNASLAMLESCRR